MTRKQLSEDVAAKVTLRAKRRCALCFAIDFNCLPQTGQIAHIDRDANNNDPDNLVWLCLRHHNDYDTRQSQGRNFSEIELRTFRLYLDSYLESEYARTCLAYPSSSEEKVKTNPETAVVASKVSLDIYDRRLPVYEACRDFVLKVIQEGRASWDDIGDFARKTEQARFICGPGIAAYLNLVSKRANDLRFCNWRVETCGNQPEAERARLVDEESEVFNWFAHQMEPMMGMFSEVMTVKDG